MCYNEKMSDRLYTTAYGLEVEGARRQASSDRGLFVDFEGAIPLDQEPKTIGLPPEIGKRAAWLATLEMANSRLDIFHGFSPFLGHDRLFVGAPNVKGRVLDRSRNFITIGRNEENDIVLPDMRVSRHHASVWKRENGLFVTDNNSLNGTLVAGGMQMELPMSEINDHERIVISSGAAEREVRHSEDRYLESKDRGLFGVFDGVGGSAGGAAAAEYAQKHLQAAAMMNRGHTFRTASPSAAKQWLIDSLNRASKLMWHESDPGQTTATVCRIVEQGNVATCVWASVGDSRLYLLRKNTLKLVTADEGKGNEITNCLGYDNNPVAQTGSFAAKPGDRLLLVTDGVTGDFEHDAMKPETLKQLLMTHDDPGAAAMALVENALKNDDRTALVVDITR